MAERTLPLEEERSIGLEHFLTSSPPLGGVLKRYPSDFEVDEISEPPDLKEGGGITIARIKAVNWETNRLVRAFSKTLGISRSHIKFAGTKDKRAITTRLFSFNIPVETVKGMDIPDVEVLEAYPSNREMELGNLKGNHFRIIVRDIKRTPLEIQDIMGLLVKDIEDNGGFPNYFGVQRFGSVRPITHLVGKNIVHGDIKEAVLSYIARPRDEEDPDIKEARKRLEEEMDFEKALKYYPTKYLFERAMIHHLKRRPEDWAGAIDSLPDNLKMLFVHAYQSYIFNRIISKRIEKGIPLGIPITGDRILPLNKRGLPEHYNSIPVTDDNIDRMKKLVSTGKGFVSGLIIGMESEMAQGEMGEIEREILEQENVHPEDFNITSISNISSRGMRRETIAPVFDLKWRVKEDNTGHLLELDFSLFRGTYATSFMREIIKGHILDY